MRKLIHRTKSGGAIAWGARQKRAARVAFIQSVLCYLGATGLASAQAPDAIARQSSQAITNTLAAQPDSNVVHVVVDNNVPPAIFTRNAPGAVTNAADSATNLVAGTNVVDNGTNAMAETEDDTLVFSPVSPESGDVGSVTNVTVAPGGQIDLQWFRIISDRNIFNPNRSSGSYRSRRSDRQRFTPRPESLSLVGTMAYEKGRFAFFDGSSSQYRKAVELNQTIAGYTVVDVAPKSVTLVGTNGVPLQLPLGMQMTRQENEDWKVSGERDASASAAPASDSTSSNSTPDVTTSSNSSAAPVSGGDAETDALKRLLQKREEEMKK